MFSRSEKYTVSGILTLLTVATTAGIGRGQEGIPAQATEPIGVMQETRAPDRIFYRNGETKTVSPETEQAVSEAPVVSEPVVSEPVSEPIVSDPVVAEETTSSSAFAPEDTAPVMEETTAESAVETPRGISTSMIASGAIAAVIVIGGLLFILRMFLRRFKPTISKEAIAPPPVASTTEPSLPHLEAALGKKKDEQK